MPLWAALVCSAAMMIALSFAIERVVLRPLVNQEPIILFMSTLGIAFFLDGFGQALFGSDVYPLNVGIPKEPLFTGKQKIIDSEGRVERFRRRYAKKSA